MLTLAELLALSTDGMTIDELRDHQAAIIAAMQALASSDDGRTDEALEALDGAAVAVETIGTSITDAEAADAAADARAQAAIDRANAAVASADGEGDDGGDGEGGEAGDGEGEGEGDAGAGEGDDGGDAGAEGDGEGEGDGAGTEGAGTETGEGDEGAGDGEPDALAASGGQAPRISNVNARRPASARPRARRSPAAASDLRLTASANAPGVPNGSAVDTPEKLAKIFSNAIKAQRNYNGPAVNVPLVFASAEFPDEYSLSENAKENERRFEKIRDGVREHGSLSALSASGSGAPFDVRYDQPFIGSDARPVRDDLLNRLAVPRGGATVLPTVKFTDLNGAVAFWDDDAGHVVDHPELTTKPIIEIEAGEPYDADTYEVTERVRFGNIKARYFPERIAAIMKALAVAQARKADTKLLVQLGSASTPDGGAVQTTSGQLLGATRDLATTLDRSLAVWRSSYRLDRGTPMAFGYPEFLFDMLRADLAREAPGSADERLAVADVKIQDILKARNVVLHPFLDGESGQVFDFQGDGPVQGWPSQVVTYLYPEGDAHFLDGGIIEFGLVRDSALNAINKYEMFAETTEGFLYHSSVDRYRLALDLCPDGTTSGPKDLEGVCSTGS